MEHAAAAGTGGNGRGREMTDRTQAGAPEARALEALAEYAIPSAEVAREIASMLRTARDTPEHAAVTLDPPGARLSAAREAAYGVLLRNRLLEANRGFRPSERGMQALAVLEAAGL